MPRFVHLHSRSGRLAVFSLLYLSEGIPVGFSTVALAAFLRGRGVSLTEVSTIVASVYAPWAFKWAWAPLIDLIRVRRLGPSRTWILFAQSMMIVTMAALLGFDLAANTALLTTLMLVHNVFAATNDVAIDAMAVRVLPPGEVGTANGFMFGSQYAGIGLGGSGALYIAGLVNFQVSFYFILMLMALILFGVTIPLREPPDPSEPERPPGVSAAAAVWGRIRAFFRELHNGFFRQGPGPLAGVLFSILPPGATALGLALSTTMQVDMGLPERTIASISLAASIAGAFGSVAGGWISDATGRPRVSLAVFYGLMALPTLFLASRFTSGQGTAGVTIPAFLVAIAGYNLCYGMRQAAFAGVFMRITNPAVAATQFTGYMALSNLGLTYSGLWQGRYADAHGYASTLVLDAAVGLIAVGVLPWVRKSSPGNTTGG